MQGAVSSKFATLPQDVRQHVGSFLGRTDQANLALTRTEFVNDDYHKFYLDVDILDRRLNRDRLECPFESSLRGALARRKTVHYLKMRESSANSLGYDILRRILQDFVNDHRDREQASRQKIEHVHQYFGGRMLSISEKASLFFTPIKLEPIKELLVNSDRQTLSFIDLRQVDGALFSSLAEASKITTMEFRDCEIENLDLSCFSCLTNLKIHNSLIKGNVGFPESLTDLYIEKVYGSGVFRYFGYIDLSQILANLPRLQTLSLNGDLITVYERSCLSPFPEQLIQLSFNRVSQETMNFCLDRAANSLRSLTLRNFNGPLLLPVLAELRDLTFIYEDEHDFRYTGEFFKRIIKQTPKLRTITLQGKELDPSFGITTLDVQVDPSELMTLERLDREKSILNNHYMRLVFKE